MCRRPPCHWLLALVPCWFSAAASAQPITAPPESPARPAVQSTAPAQQPVDENVEKAREAFRKGNVDEALNLLKEAVKKNDTLPPAKLMFARMWAEANQPSMARLALEQAAAEEPHHPDIYIQLGQIALRESRLTDALLLFREGINVLQHGKWTNEQQNNVKTACYSGVAAVHEARGHWAEAQKVLESSLELNPKIGQLRQRLGRALFMLDRREDAVKELEKACQDDPNLEPEGVTLGALFNQRGEMQKAEEFFAYAVKKSPQNLRARLAFGNWLMEQDRFDDADREATAAAGIDPKAIDARMLKGFVAPGRRGHAPA
ncbi:MAG TPA: tetratricopeptide repeat protein [Gemmatales bacterium]|nr:tetratricopeptide repeat protein [Gemmatales bacterium]